MRTSEAQAGSLRTRKTMATSLPPIAAPGAAPSAVGQASAPAFGDMGGLDLGKVMGDTLLRLLSERKNQDLRQHGVGGEQQSSA